MRVEPSPEVLRREDVAGRHEQLLARRHVIRARSKQVHDGLRDGLLVRLDRLGVTPEQVRHERHHLHLRTLQNSECRAKVRRDVVRARTLKPDRLDHEREQRLDVGRDQAAVQLEQQHDDQRALRHDLERFGRRRRHCRGRLLRGLGAALVAEHLLDGVPDVLVHLADELEERRHLGLEVRSEVPVQVEDYAQADERVFLILRLEGVHRELEHLLVEGPERLRVRHAVQHLQRRVAKLVLGSIGQLSGRRLQHSRERGHEGGDELRVFGRRVDHLDGVAHLDGELKPFLDILGGLQLLGVRRELGAVGGKEGGCSAMRLNS